MYRSCGKSVVSALFGIAVEEGKIRDIETETVTDYVPEFKGSGYDNVTLKAVLHMSSGVRKNEHKQLIRSNRPIVLDRRPSANGRPESRPRSALPQRFELWILSDEFPAGLDRF